MAEGICNEAVSKGETHKGHRERLRHRFFREGLSSFEDHNALELLLFYAIPRKDTNPIAHELIRRFGTLENVLEAPVEELERVESIGESAALFLKLCHSVALRYCANRGTELAGTAFDYKLTGDYLLRRFEKSDREEVYVIFYDRDMIYSGETLLHQGSISSASFSLRDLADAVSFYKASFVAVAHNHPDGVPIASSDDLNASDMIRQFLAHMRVTLLEHYIIAADRYTGTEQRKVEK